MQKSFRYFRKMGTIQNNMKGWRGVAGLWRPVRTVILVTVWVATFRGYAQEAVSEADLDTLLEFSTAPVETPEPTETNRVKIVYHKAKQMRDPFWPVGYEPPKKAKPAETVSSKQEEPAPQVVSEVEVVPEKPLRPQWDEALRQVSVKGIMGIGGGKYVAVVNDQVVHENDLVTVSYQGLKYVWKVSRISSDGVKFQKVSAEKL